MRGAARQSAARRGSDVGRARRFRSRLFRVPGPGGWTFARVPAKQAPPVTAGWGRTPVRASVDGVEWETSVWRGKDGATSAAGAA